MNVMNEAERLFPQFLDATDMVMCSSADTSLAEINLKIAERNLRFPLVCKQTATIREHLAAVDYAPNSARFGPFVDNVLGMNWELPSGRKVRIGERVIKSTTGYDMLRFLLHSDGRYGRAVDYVLRLRPTGGETFRAAFRGDSVEVENLRRILLRSPWLHWLDAVDLIVTPGGGAILELAADCVRAEREKFTDFIATLAEESGATRIPEFALPESDFPPLSLKATASQATVLARKLVGDFGGRVRVLCVNGVVHYYPPSKVESLDEVALVALAAECRAQGGHAYGPWAPATKPNATESRWARELEAAWRLL